MPDDNELGQSKATPEEMMSDEQRATQADQESSELQLTPEIEAMIMDKVQDIDSSGIGYTVINTESSINPLISNIDDVFKRGILNARWREHLDGRDFTHQSRATDPRILENTNPNNKKGVVYFNITGKTTVSKGYDQRDPDPNYREIPQTYYARPDFGNLHDKVVATFDLGRFNYINTSKDAAVSNQRIIPSGGDGYCFINPASQLPIRTYGLNVPSDPALGENLETIESVPRQDSVYGFALANRIPQKSFRGIVIYSASAGSEQLGFSELNSENISQMISFFDYSAISRYLADLSEYASLFLESKHCTTHDAEILEKQLSDKEREIMEKTSRIVKSEYMNSVLEGIKHFIDISSQSLSIRQEALLSMARQTISKMNKHSSNLDCLVPVYDYNGNLLWPKQMSYEEVKAFVAERDAKKVVEAQEVGQIDSLPAAQNDIKLDSGSSPE